MLLSIQVYGHPATQALGDYVHRCLESALPTDPTNPVSLVVVRLREGRRRRGDRRDVAPEARCVVEFRFERGSTLVVRAKAPDRRQVIAEVVAKASEALSELEAWPLDRRRLASPTLRRVS